MRNKMNILVTIELFVLFLIFTAAVRTVDVQAIGAFGKSVGLAEVNGAFAKLIGTNMLLYKLTDVLGILALGVVGCFGVLGLVQLIKRKSLLKVDPQILTLGCFYILVGAIYLFFEKVVINYRPVDLGEGPEASFPSSHTVLTVCVMATAVIMLNYLLKDNDLLRKILKCASWAVAAVTVVGRLLSGCHWLTDIVGGLILSAALVMLFTTVIEYIDEKKNGRQY